MKRSPLKRKTPIRRATRPKAKSLPKKRAMPSRGPWRSRAYLAFVREKPCCVCRRPGPSEAHHWGGMGSHGMGQKCSDAFVSPLCTEHHRQWHTRGRFVVTLQGSPVGMRMTYSRTESELLQLVGQVNGLAEWVAMKEAE